MDIDITELRRLQDGGTRVEFSCWDDETSVQLAVSLDVPVDPQVQGYGPLAVEAHHQLQAQLHRFQVELQRRVQSWP